MRRDAKRIGYVVSRFPKLSETFIVREMEELEARGWHIDVFALIGTREPVRQPTVNRWLARQIPIKRWSDVVVAHAFWLVRNPVRLCGLYVLVGRRLWGRPRELMRGLVAVACGAVWARHVSERKIAHVHAHFALHPAVAAMTIATLSGVSFSFTGHSADVYRGSALLRDKVQRAAFTIVVSRLLQDTYLPRLIRAEDRSRVHLIRCGVDLRRLRYKQRTPLDVSKPVNILTVARLMPVKGLFHLLDACAELRDQGLSFQCRIIGDGPLRSSLAAHIAASGLQGRVHLEGPRSENEVRAALERADIFVLPSTSLPNGLMEGVPVSIMEAMAAGVPVVATRSGGIPELVRDRETGLLVPPADPGALAEAIIRLSRDAPLARQVASNARRTIELDFDIARTSTMLHELLECVVGDVRAMAHNALTSSGTLTSAAGSHT